MSHCLTTSRMAERLGLDDQVCQPLQQVFTRWDGKGVPGDVGGEDIALSMRLFHLADTVEVHHRADGTDAAIDVARARRGKHFDPTIGDAFCAVAADVLGDPADEPDWRARRTGSDPGTAPHRGRARPCAGSDRRLHRPASPPRAGHSRRVAELVVRAATKAGLPGQAIPATTRLLAAACAYCA